LYLYSNLIDKKKIRKNGYVYVPPASLRYRVSGTVKLKDFMDVGKRNACEIETALKKIGIDLNSLDNMLDFGCGCGRTLIWFSDKKAKIYGTDIDADAIKWVSNNLDFGTFTVNGSLPPLEYGDSTFDFIYAISVFSHLNENYEFQWLKELKRVLKTKGILVVTIHGEATLKDAVRQGSMESEHLSKLQKTGFIYLFNPYLVLGVFPSWYQVSYHTKSYILDEFGKYFNVLNYIEKGINNQQDLVVLQKG